MELHIYSRVIVNVISFQALSGRDGQAGPDAAPVLAGLALDDRARRFAVVPDDAIVSPAPRRRLGVRLH